MRTALRLLIFLLALGIIYWGLQSSDIKKIREQIEQETVYVDKSKNAQFFPDWRSIDILEKINAEREKKGYSKLKINDKLSQSASARLSIILSEDDYDGSKTGITREVAVKNAAYEANLIGDLVLLDFFKNNDYIAYWEADDASVGTLLHPDFREVGIALKNSNERVSLYVIFVSPRKIIPQPTQPKKIVWGGPELWTAVNKRRVESGVNPLSKRDELCTIASIRLNQLLELNKLDGHAGFVPVLERSDLKWISEKYNISEFLVQGYPTPEETVKAWEDTMGHKALVAGGEYVWGCVYAQNTFGVAIAAY